MMRLWRRTAALTAACIGLSCVDFPVAPTPLERAEAECTPDDGFEPNDGISSAAPITLGTITAIACIPGGAGASADDDLFRFSGDAGREYRLRFTADTTGGFAWTLRLFDATSREPLGIANDGNWRMGASGTAILLVRGGGAAPGRPYTVTLVDRPNRAPLVTITQDPAVARARRPVTFRFTGSDPDGDSVRVRWRFGASDTASGPVVTRTFDAPGAVPVTVIATDAPGRTDSLATSVVVRPLVASVVVTPPASVLASLGDTVQLATAILDSAGAPVPDVPVRWLSSDSTIVRVDSIGRAVSRRNGVATISADVLGVVGTATVTVAQVPVSLVVTPTALTFRTIGRTSVAAVAVRDARGAPVAGAAPDWTSRDTSVARVGVDGRIEARGPGRTDVVARVGALRDSLAVTVSPLVAVVEVAAPATLSSFGDTTRLVAVARDSGGTPVASATILWQSSDTTVARVNALGTVTARGNGTSDVSATAGAVTGAVRITVAQVAARLTVTPATVTFGALGRTRTVAADVRDARGAAITGATITWLSRGTGVATVDAAGLVTATGAGSTRVVATTGTIRDSIIVTVTPVVATISVPSSVTFASLGDTTTLVAIARDSGGTPVPGVTPSWSSADTSIAAVTAEGLVTARRNGSTSALVGAGGVNAAVPVTVAQVATALRLVPDSLVLRAITARATVLDSVTDARGNAVSGAPVLFSSSDPLVASIVPSTRTVIATGPGVAFIIATSGGLVDTVRVRVIPRPVTLSLGGAAPVLAAVGDTVRLVASVLDSALVPVAAPPLTWTSRMPSVATVGTTGLVTAVSGGTSWVVAQAVDGAATAIDSALVTVSVAPPPPEPDSVDVTPNAPPALGAVGATLALSAAAFRAGVAVPAATFTWTSSAPTVASVSTTGVVTALATGTTWIRATSGTGRDSVSVSVTITAATLTLEPAVDTVDNTTTVTRTFAATVRDAGGAAIPGATVTWSFCGNPSAYTCVEGPGNTFTVTFFPNEQRRALQIIATSGALVDTSTIANRGRRVWTAVATGRAHTCALADNPFTPSGSPRETYCWGSNAQGQLGQGASVAASDTPRRLAVDTVAFSDLVAGDAYTCGITDARRLWCWGSDSAGTMGQGSVSIESCGVQPCARTPRPISYLGAPLEAVGGGLQPSQVIAAGAAHVCVARGFLDIICWGQNARGQSGVEFNATPVVRTPTAIDASPLPSGSGLTFNGITASADGSCGVWNATVWCWGRGDYGEFGFADAGGSSVERPRQGGGFPPLFRDRYVMGNGHGCGTAYVPPFFGGTTSAALVCNGRNDAGQIGVPSGFAGESRRVHLRFGADPMCPIAPDRCGRAGARPHRCHTRYPRAPDLADLHPESLHRLRRCAYVLSHRLRALVLGAQCLGGTGRWHE
ncbi:MAG: Ig-like domain-containing protein, partial [Gemmatimonadaceae bacterium]|nr:Ig-like domain-containing protein [Gemmatimonadaceae bacterium]